MNYAKMTETELENARIFAINHDNLNAAREISEFKKFYGNRVKVVKGRKVSRGIEGVVFFVKRYDNSKHGDSFGIYSTTRIGFKTDSGETYYTAAQNVELV